LKSTPSFSRVTNIHRHEKYPQHLSGLEYFNAHGFETPYAIAKTSFPHVPDNPQATDVTNAFELTVWSRSGTPLQSYRITPPTEAETGRELPFYAVLDVVGWPVQRRFASDLVNFLTLHGFKFRAENDRQMLETATTAVSQHPENFPIIFPDSSIGGNDYWSVETIKHTDRPLNWSRDSNELTAIIRDKLPMIDAEFVQLVYGVRSNGRNRALLWAEGGNCSLESIKYTALTLRDGTEVYMFEMVCTPSQRSQTYDVTLVFGKDEKKFFPTPISHCECKAGNLFCGHSLAFLLALSVLQSRPLSVSELVDLWPEAVKSMQSQACALVG
jgi:hypothetical protein